MIHECDCVLLTTRVPSIWRRTSCVEGLVCFVLQHLKIPFLIAQVHFMPLKISMYVLVSLVTMCLQVGHAFCITAYIFLNTEIYTKALLDTQQSEFPS